MSERREDPVLVSARREAIIVFAIFAAAMAYTLLYCYEHAYGRKIEDLKYVYGLPDWVFWGVVVPWGVCIVFCWIFASIWMRDEDLGEDRSGAAGENELGSGA